MSGIIEVTKIAPCFVNEPGSGTHEVELRSLRGKFVHFQVNNEQ